MSTRASLFREWFIGYFLLALLWFAVKAYQDHQENAAKQERINETLRQTREAVRRGEAGEAFQKLFPEDHLEFQQKQQQKINKAVSDTNSL